MRWRIEDRRVRLVLYTPFHIEWNNRLLELAYWEAFEYTTIFHGGISMTSNTVGISALMAQILNPLTIKRLSTYCIHDALSPSHLIHHVRFACQTSFKSNFVLFGLRRLRFVQNFSEFHQRVRFECPSSIPMDEKNDANKFLKNARQVFCLSNVEISFSEHNFYLDIWKVKIFWYYRSLVRGTKLERASGWTIWTEYPTVWPNSLDMSVRTSNFRSSLLQRIFVHLPPPNETYHKTFYPI